MAHFYGTLQGSRGQATRCGAQSSGLQTVAASWEGSVHVRLFYDAEKSCDMATVSLEPWNGVGTSRVLYHGPVSGLVRP